jgi:ABC-2 type transport system permease protein
MLRDRAGESLVAMGNPTRVVAIQTARRAARSGALWGLVFGIYVVASSIGFATAYPTAAQRTKLAVSLGSNPGIAALLGPARAIDTVTGFTAWRTMAVLTVVGAIWALFLATRLMRGEEDADRWELYLSGQTTRARAAAHALLGLGTGIAALWMVTAVCTLAAGSSAKVRFPVGASLYFASCLMAGAVMFVAVGALVSQVASNRRQANGVGASLIGGAFLIRMVADSTSGGAWLRWATPLGWTENLRPLVTPNPVAFIPIALLTIGAGAGAVLVAGRRDMGASVLPQRDAPPPHTRLLAGSTGLAVRLVRPVAIGWAAGLAVTGLVMGLVAQAASGALTSSPTIEQALRRIGGHGTGAQAYLGIAFSTVAALIAFAAAAQIHAARAEESSQHLDHLLVCPVSRTRWLIGRATVVLALVVMLGAVSGIGSWLGTVAQGGGVGLGELVLAGFNLVPPSIAVLGIGILAFGLRPRLAPTVAYAVVGWSFLVQLIATFVTNSRLLVDTSVLSHIAPAPAASPNWGSAAGLGLVGVAAAGLGVIAFHRRDLAGE